jgi:hypothetical protein
MTGRIRPGRGPARTLSVVVEEETERPERVMGDEHRRQPPQRLAFEGGSRRPSAGRGGLHFSGPIGLKPSTLGEPTSHRPYGWDRRVIVAMATPKGRDDGAHVLPARETRLGVEAKAWPCVRPGAWANAWHSIDPAVMAAQGPSAVSVDHPVGSPRRRKLSRERPPAVALQILELTVRLAQPDDHGMRHAEDRRLCRLSRPTDGTGWVGAPVSLRGALRQAARSVRPSLPGCPPHTPIVPGATSQIYT